MVNLRLTLGIGDKALRGFGNGVKATGKSGLPHGNAVRQHWVEVPRSREIRNQGVTQVRQGEWGFGSKRGAEATRVRHGRQQCRKL